MIKVLVTGAFGLLGSSLTPYLKACGHDVICHARGNEGDVCCDLTDFQAVNVMLSTVRPDVIVNLAALTNVDECERDPQKAYLQNVHIVENLARWIQDNNQSHLVQISTDQIYDGTGPYREQCITLSNYYGFSKYAGELAAACVPSTILRTNFFGQSECNRRSSLSDWIITSLRKGEKIKVFDDVCFSPLSLTTLVNLLERVVVRRQRGTYNLGSKEGMSKADFAFVLADALDLPTGSMQRDTSENFNFNAYRPKDMRMDSTYFEKVFNVCLPTLREEIMSMEGLVL